MLAGCVTKNGLSRSKVDPCGVCSLRVKVSSVLCVKCGKWLHIRCCGLKKLITKFSRNVAFMMCVENIGAV